MDALPITGVQGVNLIGSLPICT